MSKSSKIACLANSVAEYGPGFLPAVKKVQTFSLALLAVRSVFIAER